MTESENLSEVSDAVMGNNSDEIGEPSDHKQQFENLEENSVIDDLTKLLFRDDSSETENEMDVESDLPEAIDSMNNNSIRKEMDEWVQHFYKLKIMPDLAAELIVRKKLNTMILDLYDYNEGFDISFQKFGDDSESFHGKYSYGVSLIGYIRDGEIPYDIFDKIYNHKFTLFYDGYVLCQLRIHFKQKDCMRSHFVLLKHTIQTIDGQCAMNCKADSSLDFETERARLIYQNSPDLCLDPNPVVAEIVIANELNQHPFFTPFLKHVVQTEKARREKGVKEMLKTSSKYTKPERRETKDEDWNFRLGDPKTEEVELSEMASKIGRCPSILSYLKKRQICFPDKKSLTRFHVEIENFVYEYDGLTRTGNVEDIQDKLCIGVLDDKEYYYGAYKLDKRMKDYVAFYWWPIGNREDLDLHVNAITKLELKLSRSRMKITHNRMFSERVERSVFEPGEIEIVREKLENPASQVILQYPQSSYEDEDEDTEED